MALSSAIAQECVSRVSSYISTSKLDDKVSIAHIIARLEMALSRLEFALERTGKMPITHVSLLRRRKIIRRAYVEGTDLLERHKLHVSLCYSTLDFDELDTCAQEHRELVLQCSVF